MQSPLGSYIDDPGLRVVDRAQIVRERLRVEALALLSEVVGVGVRPEKRLGQRRRLGHQRPVPPRQHEASVRPPPRLTGGDDVEELAPLADDPLFAQSVYQLALELGLTASVSYR